MKSYRFATRRSRAEDFNGMPIHLRPRHVVGGRRRRKLMTIPAKEGETQRWEENFARLRKFIERSGHCRPRMRHPTERPLAVWLMNQRITYKQRRMLPERVLASEGLGVPMDPREAEWLRQFAALQGFVEKYGHTYVPCLWNEPRYLGRWVEAQRRHYRLDQLRPEYQERLDSIGFAWVVLGHLWEMRFAQLVEYQRRHGHSDVPHDRQCAGFAQWVQKQRDRHHKGTLDPDAERRLEAIGFAWERTRRLGPVLDGKWQRHIAELTAFKTQHGHANAPQVHGNRRGLGVWLANVRKQKRIGRLAPERIAELDALGVEWNPDQQWWPEVLASLQAFRLRHGHCRVKSTDPDRLLAERVGRLREKRRAGQLLPEQIADLDRLGFPWFSAAEGA